MSYILYDPEAPVIKRKQPKRDCTKIVLTPEQEAWLCENYATNFNADCAAHLGISVSSMHRHAKRLGLAKDPAWFHNVIIEHCRNMAEACRGEGNSGKANLALGAATRFKKGETNRDRYGEEKELQRVQKAAITRRETVRRERMRVHWGLPQETKLKIGHDRKRAYTRHTLKRRGYIIPCRGSRVAFYDSNTNRSPIVEQHAAERGITIKDINTNQ